MSSVKAGSQTDVADRQTTRGAFAATKIESWRFNSTSRNDVEIADLLTDGASLARILKIRTRGMGHLCDRTWLPLRSNGEHVTHSVESLTACSASRSRQTAAE